MISRRMIKKIAFTTLMMSTSMAQEIDKRWDNLSAETKGHILGFLKDKELLDCMHTNPDFRHLSLERLCKPGTDLSMLTMPKILRRSDGSYYIIPVSPTQKQLYSITRLRDVKEIHFSLGKTESDEQDLTQIETVIAFAKYNPDIIIHLTLLDDFKFYINENGRFSLSELKRVLEQESPKNLKYSNRSDSFYRILKGLDPERAELAYAACTNRDPDNRQNYHVNLKDVAYAMVLMQAIPHVSVTQNSLHTLYGLSKVCLAAIRTELADHTSLTSMGSFDESRLPGGSADAMYQKIKEELTTRFGDFAATSAHSMSFLSKFFAHDDLVSEEVGHFSGFPIQASWKKQFKDGKELLQLLELRLRLPDIEIADFTRFLKDLGGGFISNSFNRLCPDDAQSCYIGYKVLLEQNLPAPFRFTDIVKNIVFLKKLSETAEESSSSLRIAIATLIATFRDAGFNDEVRYDQYITHDTLDIFLSNDHIRGNLTSFYSFLNQLGFSLEDSVLYLTKRISELSPDQFDLLLETQDHLMNYTEADQRKQAFHDLLLRIEGGTYAKNPNRVPPPAKRARIGG